MSEKDQATAVPGAIKAAFGGFVGLAGASLLLMPVAVVAMLGAIRVGGSGPAAAEAPVAAAGGGGAAPVVAAAAAAPAPAPAPAGPSAAELGALRMLGPGSVEEGEEHFAAYCAACHGPDGKGKANLGKDLVHSDWVKGQSDAQLIAFIKRGRGVDDPLNTTKIPMPPKAGNPAFTDKELNDVVAYMRTLQKSG